MKKWFFCIIGAICAIVISQAQSYYTPDLLGRGFEKHVYDLPDDYHGKVVATLVRKKNDVPVQRAVLYVHGYNDYFFQKEMAEQFIDSGFNFYAVDLRKYGRSILPEHYPFEVRDLGEYFVEIDSAVCTIKNEGNREIVMMGHSTGGLITSLYCNERKEDLQIDALILNSPFLEWNFNATYRNLLIPFVSWLGSFMPDMTLADEKIPSAYGQSLLQEYHGEWSYNTDWKMLQAPGQRFSWIRAIDKGHDKVHAGLDIPCPVLVLFSDKSISDEKWSAGFQEADAVLNVDDIARYGLMLGKDVEEKAIPGGLHDLVLSRSDVRNTVYETIFKWLASKHLMQ